MAQEHPAAATAPIEDAVWVEQARTGDMSALARLVTKYQDRVLNTCWRICGDRDQAEDLAQDVFLRAIESLGGFRQKAQFYTWLFRIAVNVAISHRRKAARAVKLSLHGRDGEDLGDHQAMRLVGRVSPEPESPPARLSARETQRRIMEGLDQLDEEHRAVVVLRDIEGFDYQQMAEILELPVGTVKSRLHRARLELRDWLRPVVEPES